MMDMNTAERERSQRTQRRAGRVFTILGVLIVVDCLVFYVFHEQLSFLDNYLPSFLKSLQPSRETENGVLIFSAIGGVLIFLFGRLLNYNSKPIPQESFPPPGPLHLIQDEAWRQQSHFRLLDRLIAETVDLENSILASYNKMTNAYEKLPQSEGRVEYDFHRRTFLIRKECVESGLRDLEKAKERIQRILSGNVEPDILELQTQKERLARRRLERSTEITEMENRMRSTEDENVRYRCERKISELREFIYATDQEIIGVEADVKSCEQWKSRFARKAYESPKPRPEHKEQFDTFRSKSVVDIEEYLWRKYVRPTLTEVEARICVKKLLQEIEDNPDLSESDKQSVKESVKTRFAQEYKNANPSIFEED